jgi:putative membrane-bound dehydrogenase-like protein
MTTCRIVPRGLCRLAVLVPGLLLGVLTGLIGPRTQAQKEPAPRSPLAPEEALKSWRVPAGFRVELVAAEPLVMDPVALTWDGAGRLYVVEMGDYPLGPVDGKVKLLEDRDGDGRMERSTVFADKLPYPTGAFPWKGGLLVTAAPDILYLKDTDGDGKADERRVLFSGFGEGNQQHRVNGLMWGLDNWIHGANGDSGGAIRMPARPDQAGVDINGRDFRLRPPLDSPPFKGGETGGVIEPVSGQSQFGTSFDDWGRRFICNNRYHIRLVVLPERYLKRNPNLAVSRTIEDIAEYGSVGARIYPISPVQERFNDYDHVGHFTAACGIHVYRGGLFPAAYQGNAFVCDAVGNLVHRCLLEPNGPSLVARRADDKVEFLASTDPWCRPVFLGTGPDGALYVVDFYRAVIEHPKWIPEAVQKRIDLRAGSDRGRIYRIVPEQMPATRPPALDRATAADLVRELAHANAWRRDTAQRLLFERQERSVVPELRVMAVRHDSPQGRLRALWTLEGLGALEPEQVLAGLRDAQAGVREQALILAEPFLAGAKPLRDAVLALAGDPDPRVRFQLAFTLGELAGEPALEALARLARQEASNPWFRTAILSSLGRTAPEFVPLLDRAEVGFLHELDPGKLQFVRELAAVIGARGQPREIEALLVVLGKEGRNAQWQFVAVSGLAEGALRGKTPLQVLLGGAPEWQALQAPLQRVLQEAERVARTETQPLPLRVDAVHLLGLRQSPTALATLQQLLDYRQPQELQIATVQALGRRTEAEAIAFLFRGWKQFSPAIRREVLEVVFRQRKHLPALLDALAAGQLLPAELDTQRRNQLLRLLEGVALKRAQELLGEAKGTDRRKVVEEYRGSLALASDAQRGRQVFVKHCAACHRYDGQGSAVGPDLTDVRGRPEESLLEDLLDPNRALAPAYAGYVVETHSGQLLTGILAVETATSITLRRADNVQDLVLRKDIAILQATGQSLMPEGLEKTLARQEIADVIAYLKGKR